MSVKICNLLLGYLKGIKFGPKQSTGGSHLSRIFWEHEKSVRLKHYPAYPIIITSLIIQRNLATKNPG